MREGNVRYLPSSLYLKFKVKFALSIYCFVTKTGLSPSVSSFYLGPLNCPGTLSKPATLGSLAIVSDKPKPGRGNTILIVVQFLCQTSCIKY